MTRTAPHSDPARLSRVTRAKLMVLLPLTMALLVAATGFFALSMSERISVMYGPSGSITTVLLARVGMQIALIALIAAILGFGLAVGVTAPLREVAGKLEAVAAGDLRGELHIRSTSELDTVGGAFNDAISALNRYIFQSMTGAVITLNADGVVIGSSAAAEVILGYQEDEIVGKRFSEVFAPVGGQRAPLAAVESAIARREAVSVDEVSIAAKDGRPIRIGINVSYLRRGDRPGSGPESEAVGVTIAFKDLTEIRRLRARLQQADQLVALGTLTAGVAHELRNPLASMQGLAELLVQDMEASDPRRQYVATMLEAIGRLNRLVEELLLFSSPAAPVQEEVDVDALLRETVMFVRLGLERPVRVELLDGTVGTSVTVSGSAERLSQATTNILLNGVQATPDGGVVTVRRDLSDRHVTIAIHNPGSYIPPERMKQLFVPFFTTRPTGTGLGLAIARQIVMAHGGRVDVESKPVSGTTFTMELPLSAAAAEPRRLAVSRGQAVGSVRRPETADWRLATDD